MRIELSFLKSVKRMIDANKYTKGKGPAFFKGKEIPGQRLKVLIKNVREQNLQNTGETLVIDFEFKKEIRSIPLNKTNVEALIKELGADASRWPGHEIWLVKVLVTNPKTKEEVDGIRMKGAEKKVKTEKVAAK